MFRAGRGVPAACPVLRAPDVRMASNSGRSRPVRCRRSLPRVLLCGIERGGSRLTDLAASARMTKQSMGALLRRLRLAGVTAWGRACGPPRDAP